MPMPDHVRRGLVFERRFMEWFKTAQMLGVDVHVQQVRVKVDPRRRANRGTIEVSPDGNMRRRLLKDPPFNRRGKVRIGRIDVLAMIDDGDERTAVIIELKSSDWSRMSPASVRRNVARHASQMYSYQGHLTNQMWNEVSQSWMLDDGEVQSVQMFICYEYRPADEALAEAIAAELGEDGISVLWFDQIMTD